MLVVVVAQGRIITLYALIVVFARGGLLRTRTRALRCNGGMAGTRLVIVVDIGAQWWCVVIIVVIVSVA